MSCMITWTSRTGVLRGTPQSFEAYDDAVREVGAAVQRFDQGDVIVLTSERQVMLRIRCEKAPTSTNQGVSLPSFGYDE